MTLDQIADDMLENKIPGILIGPHDRLTVAEPIITPVLKLLDRLLSVPELLASPDLITMTYDDLVQAYPSGVKGNRLSEEAMQRYRDSIEEIDTPVVAVFQGEIEYGPDNRVKVATHVMANTPEGSFATRVAYALLVVCETDVDKFVQILREVGEVSEVA
jgi:hypothetical protein